MPQPAPTVKAGKYVVYLEVESTHEENVLGEVALLVPIARSDPGDLRKAKMRAIKRTETVVEERRVVAFATRDLVRSRRPRVWHLDVLFAHRNDGVQCHVEVTANGVATELKELLRQCNSTKSAKSVRS